MMYGTDGIMPGAAATLDQEAELRYQIRRQAHHPAIIGWSGCNVRRCQLITHHRTNARAAHHDNVAVVNAVVALTLSVAMSVLATSRRADAVAAGGGCS